MHDAQFVRLSSQATDSTKDANILPQKYYTAEAFEKFKPDCSSPPPYRHLREMQRFGAMGVLDNVFLKHKITEKQVNDLTKKQENIADLQE